MSQWSQVRSDLGRHLIFIMNPSTILIWKARGLNNVDWCNSVHDVVLSSNMDIVCLKDMTRRLFVSVFGFNYDKHVPLPGNCTCGGITMPWKGTVCQAAASVDSYSVSVHFTEQEGRNWWFTSVFGPPEDDEKLLFLFPGNWLVAGDFNLIYRAADKNNTNLNRAIM